MPSAPPPAADALPEEPPGSPSVPSKPLERRFGRRLWAGIVHALALSLALFGAPDLADAATAPGSSQDEPSKPDQVFVRGRGEAVKPIAGTILEHKLGGITIKTSSREQKIEPERVVRVQLGDVPQAMLDGRAYTNRGQFGAAADSYKLAAGQADARDVVRAAARLACAEAYIEHGAQDPSAFGLAREQAERFLTDWPDDLDVPKARAALARATLLEGDAAKAGELYAALYREAPGGKPNPGYDVRLCMQAGVDAMRAYLLAGDTLKLREIGSSLGRELDAAYTSAGDDEALQRELDEMRQVTRLTEGLAMLAGGNAEGARSFFEGILGQASSNPPALNFGARLGLAQALLRLDRAREAQLEFARVSALDYTDRYRTAQAMVGLAECAAKLPDKDAASRIKTLAQAVLDNYGDTISARRARELLNR